MREFTSPSRVTLAPTDDLTDSVFANAADHPDAVVFSEKVGGRWEPVTAKDFAVRVRELAAGLVASGVGPGDRVALMSRTRYEWTLIDYAIWTAGAVTVPVYETSSAEQVAWILGDSGARFVVVESLGHADLVATVRDQLPELRDVAVIDDGGLESLASTGRAVPEGDIEARRAGLGPDSLATIIYTSGTTGRPKGCELTHGAILFDVRASVAGFEHLFTADSSTLLFLPLAHVLGRVIQCGCVHQRVRMGHAPDTKTLVEDLAEFQPTFLLAVPRVFEKVYNTAVQTARAGGKAKIFSAAEDTAVAYSTALSSGRVPLALRLRHGLFDQLVYGKLRSALGGRVEYAVSGGAPLGARLGHFFRGVGVTVLEGYGLTESSAATSTNTPDALKIGTVGRPIAGTTVRIGDDSEVLLGGPHLLSGYWHNEAASAEAIDSEGFFHTGDLGSLDDDGFLSITGRKKELIVTAGGKNVAPAVLEDRMRAHQLISQVMVVGDGKPYVAAMVTLDDEAMPAWRSEHGVGPHDDVRENPALLAEVQGAVDDANKAVSRAEGIRRFVVLDGDFTESSGELTPSLKVKRHAVLERRAAEFAGLYADAPARS